MEPKTCLHCSKELVGRADKKFCDNQCRNEYNNTQNGTSNNYIRKVNRIIKMNRNILAELTPKDKSIKVTQKELTKLGLVLSISQIHILPKQKRHTFFAMNTAI